MNVVDWYFDFISPFAYLASRQIDHLPEQLMLRPKPILFAGLLKHWGQKGPAEITKKRQFTYQFVLWQAQRLGIPLRFPPMHPFNPLVSLRLALAAGSSLEAIHHIFHFIWGEGRLPDLPIELSELCDRLQLPDGATRIASEEVKADLRANTDEAIARGVFGVPTLAINEQLFWGVDALPMALDYLQQAPLFATKEYRQLSALPAGVKREN